MAALLGCRRLCLHEWVRWAVHDSWVRVGAAAVLLPVLVVLAACSSTSPLASGASVSASRGRETTGTWAGLPGDLGREGSASCAPNLRPGWLGRENARHGTAVAVPGTDTAANLYLDTVSATCGQEVRAAVSAPTGRYRLRVVRLGWYGGRGGRTVTISAPFSAQRQPDGPGTAKAASPGWRWSTSVRVQPSWPPGLYVVQLLAPIRPVQAAPLVVLAPSGARRSPALFVVPAMTWTAYNGYGGRSLYRNWLLAGRAGIRDRARTADIARPVEGPGVYAVHRYTLPLVRAVERAGVDVDYAADLDVDRAPSLVQHRAELITGSHAEYVTRRVVDAVEAARDAGVNLAFLGGNEFYWQARVTRDAQGRPVSMTVYRDASADPLARSSSALATVRWRDAPLRRPEARLLGGQYTGLGVVTPLVLLHPPAWLGWTAGRVVPDASASEVDAPVAGISPPNTQVLAAGAALRGGHEIRAAITYYVAPSGGAVFDAGTVFAGCSTTDTCQVIPVPPTTSRFWSETILAVVKGFAGPRFGVEHPPAADATASPSYDQLLHRYGHAAVGRPIAGGE